MMPVRRTACHHPWLLVVVMIMVATRCAAFLPVDHISAARLIVCLSPRVIPYNSLSDLTSWFGWGDYAIAYVCDFFSHIGRWRSHCLLQPSSRQGIPYPVTRSQPVTG
ncbi:hypothetical protein F5Y19DRAFT_270601 [Xylariaceae sp. FL1651]|nr:hypothetical protein F5Y19DRAFT_270601 [Xylariaceae sp. FL1651]